MGTFSPSSRACLAWALIEWCRRAGAARRHRIFARHPAPTFLFADLVGYGALTEQHGDEAAMRVAREFRRVMRALSHEHGAWHVKSMGDGAMICVPDATRAVALAERTLTEVGAHPGLLPVRIGAHTGPAVPGRRRLVRQRGQRRRAPGRGRPAQRGAGQRQHPRRRRRRGPALSAAARRRGTPGRGLARGRVADGRRPAGADGPSPRAHLEVDAPRTALARARCMARPDGAITPLSRRGAPARIVPMDSFETRTTGEGRPAALPQLQDRMFITDSGLETTLIYRHHLDLPAFAAFVLLETNAGRQRLRAYFERHAAIARTHGAGLHRRVTDVARQPGLGDGRWAMTPTAWRRSIAPRSCSWPICASAPGGAPTPYLISGCIGPRARRL